MKKVVLFLLILQCCTWQISLSQKSKTATINDTKQHEPSVRSWWPQDYEVSRNDAAGKLTLFTPYYTIQHDLKKGGAIEKISLTHGKAPNLILKPIATSIRLKMDGDSLSGNPAAYPATQIDDNFSDLNELSPSVTQVKDGKSVIVTVESQLLDGKGIPSGVVMKTV